MFSRGRYDRETLAYENCTTLQEMYENGKISLYSYENGRFNGRNGRQGRDVRYASESGKYKWGKNDSGNSGTNVFEISKTSIINTK